MTEAASSSTAPSQNTGTEPDLSDIAELSFEQAMSELEAIVKRLESGDASLDASLRDYKRGTALKEHCQTTLNNARMSVEKIMQQDQDTITTEPLDG
jgi:exodeoxyribonuclease VII small subunit